MTAEMPWGSPAGERQPLTPDRIRKQEFTRTSLGRRGYSEDEVRTFLYRVAEDMATSDKEKADLRAHIDRMKQWYKEHGMNPDQAAASQTLNVDAINILSRAQQTADAQIAEAEDYARRIVGQARRQYEELLMEAQRQAEEAANKAVGAYRASGDGLQSAEAEELERRIAYLRTFADVTQVQLRAVLEGLAHEVDKLSHVPAQAKQLAGGSLAGGSPSVYG